MYTKICFVIMPFGKKPVTDETGATRQVDFDHIYSAVFEPAISAVDLPEGGRLEPRRTDKDFFTSDISQDMFEYLEYSRMALADITGLNPNVFYELGVRHRARQSGTAIFRQLAAKIPFDIAQIKAFPYEYEPENQALESRAVITRVLTESLKYNRLDSPAQKALRVQREERPAIEVDLKAAENALRLGDRPAAIKAYRTAVAQDPKNNLVQLRLGLLLKDEGNWKDALAAFNEAIASAPEYEEAYRERGIAENKLYHKAGKPDGMPNGIASLERAIDLNPEDYDAQASLGGALKREGRFQEARAAYERAVEVSRGHSYPLMNAIRLQAQLEGKLAINGKHQLLLKRAERSLRAQVSSDPPYDPPWSFFDLAEMRLYAGDAAEFLTLANRGVEYASAAWQVKTFCSGLDALRKAGVVLPGLDDGIAQLREQAEYLPDGQ